MFQFAFAVWLAIFLCEIIGPDSSNAGAIQTESKIYSMQAAMLLSIDCLNQI
jgi:hypothetical protein